MLLVVARRLHKIGAHRARKARAIKLDFDILAGRALVRPARADLGADAVGSCFIIKMNTPVGRASVVDEAGGNEPDGDIERERLDAADEAGVVRVKATYLHGDCPFFGVE